MEFEFVYKICNKSEWLEAKQNKKFLGTTKDKEDGFVHFSDKQQVQGTLKKYYLKQKDLILLKVETLKLDNLLTPGRRNGVYAMLVKIREHANAHLKT